MAYLEIQNNGQQIVQTNYWLTPHARAGFLYLTVNAGAFRLLVPPCMETTILPEIKNTVEVVITYGKMTGKEAFEVMFENVLTDPFCVWLEPEQVDRKPKRVNPTRKWEFLIWTTSGEQIWARCPAYYRTVEDLPCGLPRCTTDD